MTVSDAVGFRWEIPEGELVTLKLQPQTNAILPPPLAWARAGRLGRRSYTPAKQAAWQAAAMRPLLHAAPPAPLTGPLRLCVVAVHPRPKALRAGPRALIPASRMDLDNCVKLVMDTITHCGRWWVDDRHVAVLVAGAWYAATGETPHTQVRLDIPPPDWTISGL